ncbi:MAG: c-type cytochrome [Cytophagaceae bacterium]|nr:MAG: c-type cytochrome [Cytophagaceae bacterium]
MQNEEQTSVIHRIIDRFALGPIWRKVFARKVPKSNWYYGDGATLMFLLLILILTGGALALMYSPAPASAYESIVTITEKLYLGAFVRAIHYWSAGMMMIILVYHLFRHLLLGGYLPPREATWIIGVLMLVLIIINGFLGYTLRWDERAVYAIRVALNIFHRIPWIGDELVVLIQGGWTQGQATLSRFYTLHIVIIPLLLLALAGYHMYLVIYHGVTTIPERVNPVETADEQRALYDKLKHSPKHGTRFFPHVLAESQMFAFCVIAIVLGLATFLGPALLMPKGNYLSTSVPMEEWWWHWFSALSAYTPPALTDVVYLGLPILSVVVLLGLPLVDHGANRGLRRRPIALCFVIGSVVALLTLTGLRLESRWTAWPTTHLAPLPDNAELTPAARQGHSLFTRYGCLSCHSIGGVGGGVGPSLTGLPTRLSLDELKRYISAPPTDVAMPAYGHRLSEDELTALASFVLVAQTFPRTY